MQKLPIGIQSFESLRSGGYLYVDKTEYLDRLVQSGKSYFLSRPRRFGKSLLLSMTKAYFEGKRNLFQGLAIDALESEREDAWQPYPVFYFDFNGKNYQAKTALETILDEQLRIWEAQYGMQFQKMSLEQRFEQLLILAAEQSGKKCVVLIDEYDKPLLEVLEDSEQSEHNKAVFKGFFSVLKKADEWIRFVLITGVTKFSKVSIFSDLNQLRDISMTKEYAGICGITEEEAETYFEEEIRQLAVAQEITEVSCRALLKQTYDGYHFHQDAPGVYNPFSLLSAFADGELRSYWFATGTPTFLVRRLRTSGYDVRKFTDRTLFASEAMLSDYRADNPDLTPLLYQTGYLTIAGFERATREYLLTYPNEEVEYGFLENLLPEYAGNCGPGSGKDIFTLRRYLERGELENIRDVFTALFTGIPYLSKDAPFEHYFQTVIYLVFTMLGKYAHCEMHTFKGRVDCVLEAANYVYLFEFKRDDTADHALKQIKENDYALPYAADRRTIIAIGVGFDSESRMLTDWKAQEEILKKR